MVGESVDVGPVPGTVGRVTGGSVGGPTGGSVDGRVTGGSVGGRVVGKNSSLQNGYVRDPLNFARKQSSLLNSIFIRCPAHTQFFFNRERLSAYAKVIMKVSC